MTFKSFLMDTDTNDYLKNKIKNLEEMECLPLELKNCSCCERHRINFPSIGNPIKYNLFKREDENVCKCPCRHIARKICKEWELVHDVRDIDNLSERSTSGSGSDNSLNDFIVPDKGLRKKERKKLNKITKYMRKNI